MGMPSQDNVSYTAGSMLYAPICSSSSAVSLSVWSQGVIPPCWSSEKLNPLPYLSGYSHRWSDPRTFRHQDRGPATGHGHLCVLFLILDLDSWSSKPKTKSASHDLTCCLISLRHAWSIGIYRILSDTSCSAIIVKIMSSSSVCIQALCIAIVVASSNAFLSVRLVNVRFLFHICGQHSLILGIEFLNLLGTIEMSWHLSKTLHGIYRSREDSEPPRWGKQPCDISALLNNFALIS